jgi:hypothetical protein
VAGCSRTPPGFAIRSGVYNGSSGAVRRACKPEPATMPEVVFAPALQRHVPCAPQRVTATDLRGALDAAFAREPRLRDYVMDERGAVRRHVAVFVDGRLIADRRDLSIAVGEASEIYVAQALSGG